MDYYRPEYLPSRSNKQNNHDSLSRNNTNEFENNFLQRSIEERRVRELDKQTFLLKEEIIELKCKLAESERINNRLHQELQRTEEQLTSLDRILSKKDEDMNEQLRFKDLDVKHINIE
jgi:hypothetical protein